jgi:hypothetical protein
MLPMLFTAGTLFGGWVAAVTGYVLAVLGIAALAWCDVAPPLARRSPQAPTNPAPPVDPSDE